METPAQSGWSCFYLVPAGVPLKNLLLAADTEVVALQQVKGLCQFVWVWWVIGAVLQGLLFKNSSRVAFWGIYAAAWVLLVLFYSLVLPVFARWLADRSACTHGIRGGKALRRCNSCVIAEAKDAEDAKEQRRRDEVGRQVRKAADSLRAAEHARLGKVNAGRLEYLNALSPVEFERAVAAMYRSFGFSVQQTPQSNDFGRDLILVKDGETTFVECKKYGTENAVGRPALQKFYAAVATMGAKSGICVTTSRFTTTARAFAAETHIELVDGSRLVELMRLAFPLEDESIYRAICRECGCDVVFDLSADARQVKCANGHCVSCDFEPRSWSWSAIECPTCTRCGRAMRLVEWRGKKFWGCTGYPSCRITLPYLPIPAVSARVRSGSLGKRALV